jgi:hypothetical protein
MKRSIGASLALVAVGLVLGVTALAADRLILRDGRSVEGQLISVQGGTIQFREDRGFRGSRVLQIRREDVERIELEEGAPSGQPERRGEFNQPAGRPSGLREQEVWVGATIAWTDTGIDVRDGQVVYFTTNMGDIQWRRGQHTRAAGDPGAPYNARRPLPSRPIGALIAKIGANANAFVFIGDNEGPIRMRGSGRLFLGINDENLADNQGAYRVTVYY